MYLSDNSTGTAEISPAIESDRVSRMYSDLYILFAFMGFIIGSFVLFFTINVSKARLGTRNNTKIYVIDSPPRYSEVVPPPYEWVMKHLYRDNHSSEMQRTLNLSTVVVIICSCFMLL